MSDIVERLRTQDPNGLSILLSIHEAADEIERLTAVLRYIIEIDDPTDAPILARAALAGQPFAKT